MTGVTITGIGTVEPRAGDRPTIRDGVPAPALARVVPARLDAERALDPRTLRKVSDHTRLVTVATSICLEDAQLTARDDLGICIGTSFGSSAYHLEYHEALRRRGVGGASALLFTQSVFNAATGHVGQVFGMRGSNLTLVGGESIGLEAIARATVRVQLGSDRALLAGGAEQYSDLVHASLHQSGLVGSTHDGVPDTFAEGAALLALERTEHADARGATRYADVLGTGHARRGAVRDVVARAIDTAGRDTSSDPARIDLIIASCAATAEARSHLDAAREITGAPPLEVECGAGFAFTSALAACHAAERIRDLAAARVLVLATTAHNTVAAILLGKPRDPTSR